MTWACPSPTAVPTSRTRTPPPPPLVQTMVVAMEACSAGGWLHLWCPICGDSRLTISYPPPPPLRACPSIEWVLNRCFQDFLGPLFFVFRGPECRIGRL